MRRLAGLCGLLLVLGLASATNFGFHLRDAVPTGNVINAVAVGTSAIVAVGADNLLISSTDGGETWTPHDDMQPVHHHGNGQLLEVVTYSPDLDMFLVCGFTNGFVDDVWTIYSYGNASQWTVSPTPMPFCDTFEWVAGQFSSVNGDGTSYFSADGLVWETVNQTQPEECSAVNVTCEPVGFSYSTYLKAWVTVFHLTHEMHRAYHHQSVIAASKDGGVWSTLTTFDLGPSDDQAPDFYFYDSASVLAWSIFNATSSTYSMVSYNVETKAFVDVNPPPAYGSLIVLEEFNGTMYWVSQSPISNEPPVWSIRICLSADGVNWLDAFNNTYRHSWNDVGFDAARNTLIAVGSAGHIAIGHYYPNSSYEVFEWRSMSELKLGDPASYDKVIWIDAHNEYLAGPMLVSSKTSHKWEPVISEIDLQIDRWEYIAQSPYAQYFAIGDGDHYILSGQSPKRWTAYYVQEVRSHKPTVTAICGNGGPTPGSVLVMAVYTGHDDPMGVRSLDGGQTWSNIIYFQPGAPIRQCTYGNGMYVGLTHHPHIYTTVNGSVWHKVGELDKPTRYDALNYLNGRFIAVGNNCSITTSLDGVNWGNQTIPGCESALNGVSWSQNVGWMFVGEDGTFYTSRDLATFTKVETASYGKLSSVAYSDALNNWVIVGPNSLIQSQIIQN